MIEVSIPDGEGGEVLSTSATSGSSVEGASGLEESIFLFLLEDSAMTTELAATCGALRRKESEKDCLRGKTRS
jgi:hypothetical protein